MLIESSVSKLKLVRKFDCINIFKNDVPCKRIRWFISTIYICMENYEQDNATFVATSCKPSANFWPKN